MKSTSIAGEKALHGPVTRFARLSCGENTARMIADALAEQLEGESVAAFEIAPGQWAVELHFGAASHDGAIRDVVCAVAGDAAASDLHFGEITERDWVAASLEGLKSVTAGRFLIHGGHDRARARTARYAIEIEAALAFGTGHHGTTLGCLLAFDRLLRTRHLRRVLDVGTGTGILAIAAARVLRRRVVGTDIDKVAVRVARDNAALNRVAPLFRVIHTDRVAAPSIRRTAPYDLVFANILLPPLRNLARPLSRLLARRARVILSGLLPEHANAAIAVYRAQGLILERKQIVEGWVTLLLRRGA